MPLVRTVGIRIVYSIFTVARLYERVPVHREYAVARLHVLALALALDELQQKMRVQPYTSKIQRPLGLILERNCTE